MQKDPRRNQDWWYMCADNWQRHCCSYIWDCHRRWSRNSSWMDNLQRPGRFHSVLTFHGCDGGKAIVRLTCLVLLLSPPCIQEDHGGAISLRRVKASGMEFVAVVKKCAARSRSYVFSAVIDFESFERWSEGPVQLSLILLPPRKSSRGPRQFSEGLGVFGDRGVG